MTEDEQFVVENVVENVVDKSLEEKIIEQLKIDNTLSASALAKILRKSSRTIQRVMASSNEIKHVSPDKGGHWEIIDKD